MKPSALRLKGDNLEPGLCLFKTILPENQNLYLVTHKNISLLETYTSAVKLFGRSKCSCKDQYCLSPISAIKERPVSTTNPFQAIFDHFAIAPIS